MNKFKRKRAIIIDVDGTMYDNFKKDDRKIIRDIFLNSIIINKIDDILWSINSMDFLSNSMGILKLRFVMYSVLGRKKYSQVYYNYEEEYKKHLKKAINCLDKEKLGKIMNKYNVIIITNNPFSVSVLKKYFKNVVYSPNAVSRKKAIKDFDNLLNIRYVVGNNFTDDIYSARCINAESVYIGSSCLGKVYNADYNANSFDEAMTIILEND